MIPNPKASLSGISRPAESARTALRVEENQQNSPAAAAAAPVWVSRTNVSPAVSASTANIKLRETSLTGPHAPGSAKEPKIIRNPAGSSSSRSAEHKSLQETLRALAPEGGENDIYWLPVAVARLGFKNANIRTAGLNLDRGGERAGLDGDDKLDPTKALLSRWDVAAKTEEKLFELQQKEQRKQKVAAYGLSDSVDGLQQGKTTATRDPDDDDEDLQELLDEMKLSGPNAGFKRVGERRSKRFTSAFEEEIAERNEHLKQRMEQMNSRVKRFEKGFEALDCLAVKMDQLAESSKLRVQFLEQCLVPLYNESARHQICRNNAEKALAAIDTALHHYEVPDELTAVIQAGPVKNLPAYCASLERVKASMDFFSEFHTTTAELDQVSTMYRTGRENLIKEFRDLLRMHSKAVPSVMIHDAIVNNLRDPSISHDFAHFAETVYNDLKLVTQWFQTTKDKFDFMDVYASFRLAAMRDSLDQFRTFYKEAAEAGTVGLGNEVDVDRRSVTTSVGRDGSVRSADADAGFDEDSRSISIYNTDEGTSRGGLLKPSTLKRSAKSTPRKKAAPGAHGGTVTAGLFQKLRRVKTGSAAAKKLAGTRVGIDDDTYQKVEIYMALVSAFLKLVESEVGLMYGIIPDEHMRDVFDRIVMPAIERFGVQGKELAEKILLHVQNGDFSAVLLLLQVLEHFEALKPLFASALEGCTHDTQQNWAHVQQIFRTAVQRTMDGFLSSIKTTTDRVLPSDGTVHEITSNTIAFLSNLVDYRPLFDAVLSPEPGKAEKKHLLALSLSRPAHASQAHNFPQYLNSVVTHLLASLTTRAENYNDQTLKAIFLLNNISYMFNYLRQAGIIDVMKEDNPDVDKLIGARMHDQKSAYVDCWSPLTRLLTEAIGDASFLRSKSPHDVSMQATTTNYDVQLKEKDRQAIKDRCTAVNKELVQQTSKQEKYSVPDQTLRSTLQHQNRDMILSLYNTYREKYARIPFTKFHEKYLPYTSAQVSDMLDRFFSQDTFSMAMGVPAQTFRIDE